MDFKAPPSAVDRDTLLVEEIAKELAAIEEDQAVMTFSEFKQYTELFKDYSDVNFLKPSNFELKAKLINLKNRWRMRINTKRDLTIVDDHDKSIVLFKILKENQDIKTVDNAGIMNMYNLAHASNDERLHLLATSKLWKGLKEKNSDVFEDVHTQNVDYIKEYLEELYKVNPNNSIFKEIKNINNQSKEKVSEEPEIEFELSYDE